MGEAGQMGQQSFVTGYGVGNLCHRITGTSRSNKLNHRINGTSELCHRTSGANKLS